MGLEALDLLKKPRFSIPPIPEAERTPLVTLLLGLIEDLAERVQKQDEEIALLKDEVRVLKGQKKRPQFKPSKMDERTDPQQSAGEAAEEDPRRPGSDKRSKKAELVIHDEKIIRPQRRIPKGSRFKGYRDVIIQDLIIEAHIWPIITLVRGCAATCSTSTTIAKSRSRCCTSSCASGASISPPAPSMRYSARTKTAFMRRKMRCSRRGWRRPPM
jgi:hypothetical protein